MKCSEHVCEEAGCIAVLEEAMTVGWHHGEMVQAVSLHAPSVVP
jgi:hypothetical protein